MTKFFRSADDYTISVPPHIGPLAQDSAGLPRRELAYRLNDGLEVTLSWHPERDELIVCVCDQRDGAYFEIHPEHHLALEVYYHPYAYLALSDVHFQDARLAA